MNIDAVKAAIRDVPDFPKPGIIFKDITPVLADPRLFADVVSHFAKESRELGAERIIGVDARGFIFGAALALELGLPFVPLRKKGKLPYKCVECSYDLEYGEATLAMHVDAIQPGESVIIVDDLLATGGTAKACAQLVEELGGTVAAFIFLVELGFLKGRDQLQGYKVSVPIIY